MSEPMSRPKQSPKPSNSASDAMPFAKQAWAVSTEGERAAIRLGLIPLRLAVNFGKWSTPGVDGGRGTGPRRPATQGRRGPSCGVLKRCSWSK